MKSYIDRDKIMKKDEFYKLGKADRRALMSNWRLIYPTSQIQKEMNISNTSFYSLLKRLDLPTNLLEWKSSQPSLLDGESKPTKTPSEPQKHASETFEYEVRVTGRVGDEDLLELLKIAQSNKDLEITITK